MAGIALVFAELAGCLRAWQDALGGWDMTESQVVNGWIEKAERETTLRTGCRYLLRLLASRFPGAVPPEFEQLIRQQESPDLLEHWHEAALQAATVEEFLAVLRS
jgi:hypothetical protein